MALFVFAANAFAETKSEPSCDILLNPQTLHVLNRDDESWIQSQTEKARKAWVDTELAEQNRHQLNLFAYGGNQLDIFVSGGYRYEFRTSKYKPRGVLARNSLKLGGDWEVILDLQKLSEEEGVPWVYQSASVFKNRCLFALSKGGLDANVIREFDLKTKSFVPDGFFLDEGFNEAFWDDEDSIYVLAENNKRHLTDTGHPRHFRLLKRHQKLEDAKILRSLKSDEKFHLVDQFSDGYQDVLVDTTHRSYDESTTYLRFGKGKWHRLPLAAQLQAQGFIGNHIIFVVQKTHTRKDGSLIPKGTVISWHRNAVASETLRYQVLWQPHDSQTLAEVHLGDSAMLLLVHEPTQNFLQRLDIENGKVVSTKAIRPEGMPHLQIAEVSDRKDAWWVEAQNPARSSSQFYLGKKPLIPLTERDFDFSDQYDVEQLWTEPGKDGHPAVPYLIFKDKKLDLSKPSPTIIEVYGSFDTPATPPFSKETIDLWVARGGVFVYPMVHGSAERGWRANDRVKGPSPLGATDTIMVAEDLIKRGITSSQHLGLTARSGGGRWVALASLMRPDLFKAVVCSSCVLDLIGYTQWGFNKIYTSEYGDPRDPTQLQKLKNLSPVHYPVAPSTPLPSFLMISSRTDDRVAPAHSRRFTQRMQELGAEAYLLEFNEGGHMLTSDFQTQSEAESAEWAFLQSKLNLNLLTK